MLKELEEMSIGQKLYNFMKQRNIFELIQKHKNRKKSFKERLIETFGVNPCICTSCGNEMMLWEIWHRNYGVIYNVLDKSNYKNIINEIDEFMPELVCPNCRVKFEYKKTDDR